VESELTEVIFDLFAEEVFAAEPDDGHFALGVFSRVAGVGGVDHDGGAELASDGSWGSLRGIGGAEHVADLLDGVNPFVDEGDAFLGAGLFAGGAVAFAGAATGHEAHDVLELLFAGDGAEELAELLFDGVRHLETEFGFDYGRR